MIPAIPQAVVEAFTARGYHAEDTPMLMQCRALPVSFRDFVGGGAYLNLPAGYVWPAVAAELERLNNPEGRTFSNPYNLAVWCGSIGSGKSLGAVLTTIYQLYLLTCLRDPAVALGLAPGSELMIALHAISAEHAEKTDFAELVEIVGKAPYFKGLIVRSVEGEIEFPGRIVVRSLTDSGALGQNVVGGIVDEVNYQSRVRASVRAAANAEGVYDQASEVFSAISTRRQSRFEREGRALPGIINVVSSKRSPEDFTARKIAEAETDPSIFVSDLTLWAAKPAGTYSARTFRVFCGDTSRQGRVLAEGRPSPRRMPSL